MPENLVTLPQTQDRVLLLVASHYICQYEQLAIKCQQHMQPFLVNIWPQFFDVCCDRSKKYSLKFFSDPVVHHLWGRFIIDKAGLVAEYI